MIEVREEKELSKESSNNREELHQTGVCLLLDNELIEKEQKELDENEVVPARRERYETDYCSICTACGTQMGAQELPSVQTEVRSATPTELDISTNHTKLTETPPQIHCRTRLVVCRSCLSDNLNYCAAQGSYNQAEVARQEQVQVKVESEFVSSCSGCELEVQWSQPRGLLGRVAGGLRGETDGGACTRSFKLKSSKLAGGEEKKRRENKLISNTIRSILDSLRWHFGDISKRSLNKSKKFTQKELGARDKTQASSCKTCAPLITSAVGENSTTQLRVSCSFQSSISSTSMLEIQRSIDLEVIDDSCKVEGEHFERAKSELKTEKMAITAGSGCNLRKCDEADKILGYEKSPTTRTSADGGSNNNKRRSTYSSIGLNEQNFDSSYSSAINNSASNNTCAINCSGIRNSTERISNWICHRKSPTTEIGINQVMKDGQAGFRKPSQSLSSRANNTRDHWKNIEFLLAVIGFAVDLGNVWRFPYICYLNGGGAFLIPYTVMFILGGLPIFYLEMSLGQYFSSGCLTVWGRICPIAKGIGYAMCVLNFYTGLFYNTIISWAVFFFVESFTTTLPWTSCNNTWSSDTCRTIDQRQALKTNLSEQASPEMNSSSVIQQLMNFSRPTQDYFDREVLQIHLSKGIDDLGQIRKPLAIYLGVVFICIYFAIWKGVKSTGKAVWITSLLPYFVLIPLLVRGIFLEGSWDGIRYYLSPNWLKIWDVSVWVEAAKQIYFSLGPGFGTLMALSSYNKFNHNCRRDALIAASVNYFASFIAGFVIFSVLGYMAAMENVPLENVATDGPGLVFQVYPEGLATMRFSPMWSVLFFMMVITLGIDSTFGGLESVITGLCDEYPRILRANRGIFIGFLIIVIYMCSLPTTTYGGNYVMNLIESYGTTLSLLFIVLAETIVVCWIYGADRFCKNLEEMHGRAPGPYWRICWKYISPTILLLIFFAACYQELDKYRMLQFNNYTYPGWATVLGLVMTSSSACCIPIYAIYHLITKTSGSSFCERVKSAFRPSVRDKELPEEFYFETLTDKITDGNN